MAVLPSKSVPNFLEINLNENGKILEMNTFANDCREDPNRSFEIKFQTTEARQEFNDIVKDRQEEIKKFDEAKEGSMHTNHTFFKFQNEYHEQVFFILNMYLVLRFLVFRLLCTKNAYQISKLF